MILTRHRVEALGALGAAGTLSPGIYLVRVTQAGERRVARAVVLR